MRKFILPLIAVAGTLSFGTFAHANEPNRTPAGMERNAAPHTAAAERHDAARHGLAFATPSHGGNYTSANPAAPGLSPSDALLFELGDRGLGGN